MKRKFLRIASVNLSNYILLVGQVCVTTLLILFKNMEIAGCTKQGVLKFNEKNPKPLETVLLKYFQIFLRSLQ